MAQNENKTDSEKLQWECEMASTSELAFMMQKRKHRKRQLKGTVFASEANRNENHRLNRELRMMTKIMKSRQLSLFEL